MTSLSSTQKKDALKERMLALHIYEEDLIENFILGSGSGGQKINKTSSCVQLQHIPTGIEIKCQRARSREANRIAAREELCKRIENRIEHEKKEKQMLSEKARRRDRKPSRAQKARRLAEKRHVKEKKSRRVKVHKNSNHD